jgi:hypothetical protein
MLSPPEDEVPVHASDAQIPSRSHVLRILAIVSLWVTLMLVCYQWRGVIGPWIDTIFDLPVHD